MGSRYMIYWRAYIYANNLYSLPDRYKRSFREWTPLIYRSRPEELHRVLSFANRDLSILLCNSQADVLHVFDMLLELLLDVNMKNEEFTGSLLPHLGSRTKHFVHELINFARSPYDSLISYECNVQYYSRSPELTAGNEEKVAAVEPMEGLRNFVDFTARVDEDECAGLNIDLDLEDDETELSDELTFELAELNEPLMQELRRLLQERNGTLLTAPVAGQGQAQAQTQAATSESQVQTQNQRLPPSQPAMPTTSQLQQQQQQLQQQLQAAHSQTPYQLSVGTSGAVYPTVILPNDMSLEVAIERSMMERISTDYYMGRRAHQVMPHGVSFPRTVTPIGMSNRNTNEATAAAVRVAQQNAAAAHASLRAALRAAPRVRGTGVAIKRRRTVNRDLDS